MSTETQCGTDFGTEGTEEPESPDAPEPNADGVSMREGLENAVEVGRVEWGNQLGKRTDRAQMTGGSNMVGLFIGLMIAAIVALQVFIPVVNDAIASANLSGNEETVATLLPLFAVLLLLIALAGPLMTRV